MSENLGNVDNLLGVENLHVMRGGKDLCRALSVTIRPGELWGVLGENGSGKSSLLHTLAGLEKSQGGHVRIEQKPVESWRRKALARRLGLLPQQRQEAFPLRVAEAVAAGRFPHHAFWRTADGNDCRLIQAALEVVGLQHKADRLLQELSGGEQQRVAIATLLVQDPGIFLLDEPCNHLDVRHQVRVLNHFRVLVGQGKSALMALHDVNLASRYCSHLILLFPGGDTLEGKTDALLTEANLSRLYSHPIREICDGRDRLWLPV